MSVIK
jgi:dynein heavy chain